MTQPNSSSSNDRHPRITYRYFVVYYDPVIERPSQLLNALNRLLGNGWKPVRERSMGEACGTRTSDSPRWFV